MKLSREWEERKQKEASNDVKENIQTAEEKETWEKIWENCDTSESPEEKNEENGNGKNASTTAKKKIATVWYQWHARRLKHIFLNDGNNDEKTRWNNNATAPPIQKISAIEENCGQKIEERMMWEKKDKMKGEDQVFLFDWKKKQKNGKEKIQNTKTKTPRKDILIFLVISKWRKWNTKGKVKISICLTILTNGKPKQNQNKENNEDKLISFNVSKELKSI